MSYIQFTRCTVCSIMQLASQTKCPTEGYISVVPVCAEHYKKPLALSGLICTGGSHAGLRWAKDHNRHCAMHKCHVMK